MLLLGGHGGNAGVAAARRAVKDGDLHGHDHEGERLARLLAPSLRPDRGVRRVVEVLEEGLRQRVDVVSQSIGRLAVALVRLVAIGYERHEALQDLVHELNLDARALGLGERGTRLERQEPVYGHRAVELSDVLLALFEGRRREHLGFI